MTNYYGVNPSEIFRGIGKAAPAKYETKPKATPLADEAANKAIDLSNKSGITVALEDFTKLTDSFNSNGKSHVSEDNVKKKWYDGVLGFFGKKEDNVFKTSTMRNEIKGDNSYTQADIFAEDIAKNGGLLYAKEDDDIYKSALNYAKADIGAIEKSYSNANVETGKKSKLDFAEISTYISDNDFLGDNMKYLDLDGKPKTISTEEYASYVVTADTNRDGKITAEESTAFQDTDVSKLKDSAKSIFDQQYKK